MYTEHSYAVQNQQNVEVLEINKKNSKNYKIFSSFSWKKLKLTFESFFSSPVCSYNIMNHKEQFLRPQKFLYRNFYSY
jgi:ribosomal protein L23